MRLLCLFVLSGCSLYFGDSHGKSVDAAAPSPDAAVDVDAASDPSVIARPCIRAVAGGAPVFNVTTDVFLTYVCAAPLAGGIIEWLHFDNGRLNAGMPRADFQQPFVRAVSVGLAAQGQGSVLTVNEHTPGGWLLGINGGMSYASTRPFTDITIGNLDGKGLPDIVLAGDGAIRMQPGFFTQMEPEVVTGKPFTNVVLANFGGSPARDLFFVATMPGQPVEVGLATQTAADPLAFAVTTIGMEPGGVPVPMAVGDLDGDFNPDVIGGAARVFVYSSKTGGILALDEAPSAVAVGDFDADGKVEAIFMTADRTQIRRVQVSATGQLSSTLLLAKGGDSMAIPDLDGDGRADILLVHDAGTTSSTLTVHLTP